MKKLFLSILFLSHAGLQIMAGTEQSNSFHYSRYSPMVDKFMYFLASSSALENFDRERRGELAKHDVNKYTELFQNAQREIGIQERDVLPIGITLVEELPNGRKLAIACTSRTSINIVPENFDERPYGVKRIIALHESFHHKYHDACFEAWMSEKLEVAILSSTIITTSALWTLICKTCTNNLRFVGYAGAPALAYGLSLSTLMSAFFCVFRADFPTNKYDWYKEFRADRDAVEHARCYKCVEEYSGASSDLGQYLNKKELRMYIDQFKKENLLCTHHR